MGGANMSEKLIPYFSRSFLGESRLDMVLLMRAVQDGWLPDPSAVDLALYHQLRHAESSAMRAFVGVGCTFGARWFEGFDHSGVAAGESYRALARLQPVLQTAGVSIENRSYEDWTPLVREYGPRLVVYCDPPYAGRKGYGRGRSFDSAQFWDVMCQWSSFGASVFVSEYRAPSEWASVWSKRKQIAVATDKTNYAVEHLFAPASLEAWMDALSAATARSS